MAFTILNEADASNRQQSEIDSVDIDILAAGHGASGVLTGCAVTAQGSPDLTVAVAAGTVVVSGTIVAVSSGNVTITAADSANPRFDLIAANSSGTKSAVKGTAATNPVFPAIPAGSIILAAVYVPASDTTIESNQITDKRVIIAGPGYFFIAASNADARSKARRDFTCDGTADDVQILLAIALVAALGGGTVELSEGLFSISSKMTITSNNVRLVGQGRATVLQQDADVVLFEINGVAASTEHALDSDATADDTTLALVTGAGSNYSAEDWILVLSDATWRAETSKIGELQQIASISTDTLTLKGHLRDSYATSDTASVKLVTPVDGFSMSNMRITNSSQGNRSQAFIRGNSLRHFSFRNLFMDFADDTGIDLNLCWDGNIDDVLIHDFTSDTNEFGYGVQITGASEGITVSNLVAHDVRHAITSGPASAWSSNGADHGIPRGVSVNNVQAYSCKSSGIDTHEEAEGWVFSNCISHGNNGHGFQIRAVEISLTNCHAYYNLNGGIRCSATSERIGITNAYLKGNADGLLLTGGCDQIKIIGSTMDGNAEGVDINGVHDELIITSNSFVNNSTDIAIGGATITNSFLGGNTGRVTESSGTATISSGNTSVTVTHGLSVTPTLEDFSVVLGENPTNDPGNIWIDTITSTQFNINCRNDPGASNLDLAWIAQVINGI